MKPVIALALLVGLCGCSLKAPKLYKPDHPAILADGYALLEYQADKKAYEDAVKASNLDAAKLLRDKMVWNMLWVIDNNFSDYSEGLGAARATGGFGSDVLQSGIASATAIVHAERIKELLGVALLGTQGLERSVKSRYFANVSPETFIGAMQSARQPIEEGIQKSLSSDVKDYPMERARADLGRLFWAGTLQSALQYMAQLAQLAK